MSILKDKKVTLLISIILVFIFSVNIAYATTNNRNSKLNVEFDDAFVIDAYNVIDDTYYIRIKDDKKDIDLDAGILCTPGAYIAYSVDIVNNGNVTAKVDSLDAVGFENAKALRILGLDNIRNNNIVLRPGERHTIMFTIKWDESYTEFIDEEVNFKLDLNCSEVQ